MHSRCGVVYLITQIDLTIVNVSLPTIGRDLHLGQLGLQWVASVYALTFGGFLLLGGRFADLLGRRRILMSGLTLFTAASLGCALATGEGLLIAMRALQAAGAALMIPAALSVVTTMFVEGTERNRALGIWGGLGAAGGTIGLIAGGVITRYVGWEYIFYLNVPIGVAALALAPRLVPDSSIEVTRRRFDVAGAASVTGGLVLLLPPARSKRRPRRSATAFHATGHRPEPVAIERRREVATHPPTFGCRSSAYAWLVTLRRQCWEDSPEGAGARAIPDRPRRPVLRDLTVPGEIPSATAISSWSSCSQA